eukprot:9262711-Pyramimonas_sp.AAC.1
MASSSVVAWQCVRFPRAAQRRAPCRSFCSESTDPSHGSSDCPSTRTQFLESILRTEVDIITSRVVNNIS